MPRPIHAIINTPALTHNLSMTRQYAQNARIMTVIKANAYGHGLITTAHALRHTDGYALLELDAAIELREKGFQHPMLLLEGFFSMRELSVFEKYRFSTVIHHEEQIAMLANCNLRELDVFLKINTGMNRLGFSPEQFPEALKKLSHNPAIANITVMTHFATADEGFNNEGFVQQLQLFNGITQNLQKTGSTRFRKRHPLSLANSAAIIRYPETHQDWIRPGLMLYGASPFAGQTGTDLQLKPVMTLASRIIAIHQLKKGDKVSYGGHFQADKPMRIGIVACGYADGYPRHAPTGTPVLVNKQRCRLIGRVSMDMIAVDITEASNVQLNSPVILWGNGLPVEEIARAAGTISYELLCAVSTRVKMIVSKGGMQDETHDPATHVDTKL